MRKLFFSFLLSLFVPMVAGAQEMYAVYDDGKKTFTFYYDSNRAGRSGEIYDLTPQDIYIGDSYIGSVSQWFYADWKENVKKAVFDASFVNARPTTTCCWFYEFRNMKQVEGIEFLNTSEVTDMYFMFGSCSSLTSLDVSHFETGKVTNMSSSFSRCSSLTTLNLSNFDTSNVTDCDGLFYKCSSLIALDVGHFDTSNVTCMDGMFSGCSSLTTLDVSHFDTRKVTSMHVMFADCSMLTSLDVSNFETRNLSNIRGMFYGCTSLTTIYCDNDWYAIAIDSFDNGIEGGEVFYGCTRLVGGAGTVYDSNKIGAQMARPDAMDNPGYFTRKADGGTQTWAEGDLNHDGKVDAADVVWLTNLIMNQK